MSRPVVGGSSTPVAITDHELASSIPVYLRDSPSNLPVPLSVDAFSRLRASSPTTLFDSQSTYDLSPLSWFTKVTGGGSVAYNSNGGFATVNTDTASGSQAIRQTKTYMRYQPGKSQLILMTGVFDEPKTNVVQSYGYFDAADGMFFMVNVNGMNIVARSAVSGSPVDIVVSQAEWNLDKLDGTGPSGVALDFQKAQIYVIDFEALYVGRVRFGFIVDGAIVYCHQATYTNVLTVPYIRTANLPIRCEVTNTGISASATTLKQICCSVISEGGFEEARGVVHSTNNATSGISVSTRRAVLSISPKTSFGGRTVRGQIIPKRFKLFAIDQNVFYEVVYNGTISSPSWTSVGANSIVNYDVAGTTVTGGEIIDSGYIGSGVGVAPADRADGDLGILFSRLPLALDIDGANPIALSLVVTAFTSTATVWGALKWSELY